MIELRNVCKKYKNSAFNLRNISLSLPAGSMSFLTGPSGSGKSTLLRMIAGLERPTSGAVTVAEEQVDTLTHWELPHYRRQIGVVFQDHQLIASMTAFENVALPLQVSGYAQSDIERRVKAALNSVGLAERMFDYPEHLSGGEQQRVGIARAVVAKPSVLIADEPTGNLDPQLSREIMGLLHRFSQVGVTVLIATHDTELVEELEHPVYHLSSNGLEVCNGSN